MATDTVDGLTPFTSIASAEVRPQVIEPEVVEAEPGMSDGELIELFKQFKRECFEGRWVFERQWMRNIYYVLNRQWIRYNSKAGEWQDKRLAQWIPRPANPDLKNGVQAIRAMFASTKIGINARPAGQEPEHVSTAATADDLAPVLHDVHDMNAVMNEFDFWLIVTGNAFLYTYLDYDLKHGVIEVRTEQCLLCGETFEETEIADAGNVCPGCKGGNAFTQAMDPKTGKPLIERRPMQKSVTRALSPLELAFPQSHSKWDDVPGAIVMRWRTKRYYEGNPALKDQVANVKWQKSPQERSMQIFKAMPALNDLGINPFVWGGSGTATQEEEGIPEYELHLKPCDAYPEGLVARFIGDGDPIVVHCEDEALPGPLPYKDGAGKPLFTITHAAYEHVGGRVLGSGALDPVIGKVDQLNQLDSMMQMITQRMANPVWLEPKGAEVEKFTGQPGLVVKWNPLTVQGGAKPERIPGEGPHASLFQLRAQYKSDIEEGLGTYDIVKGAKPTGVEAFTALQLLVERSQSRFASVFQARGDAYKDWFKFAIEIEREFGPEERTRAVQGPSRQWTFQVFKRANLSGLIDIVVEDGSTAPKTALGVRAAVEHLHQLGVLDMADPDQRYEVLRLFGQAQLIPSLDRHMQAALRKQHDFEEWVSDPLAQEDSFARLNEAVMKHQEQIAAMPPPEPVPELKPTMEAGPDGKPKVNAAPPPPAPLPELPPPPSINTGNPLEWLPWWDARIHKQEFLKWMNGDRMMQLLKQKPELKELLIAHLTDIDGGLMVQQMQAAGGMPPPRPGGAGTALAGANREAGSVTNAAGGGGVPPQK